MNDTIFKTIELANNHILEIRDDSRQIGADAHVVIMGARMQIRVKKNLFVSQEISDTQFVDILETLGDTIPYEYKSERNMIMTAEKDRIFEALVETFLKNVVPYISRPIFPEKMILKEYKERIEKKNRYN
ncbi:MAG: hypothetical protein GY710_13245 [Desulfobacteraceae bacterium]|nr:hypothetical protein [Desulfobacteraceae bacterium]